MAKPEDLLAEAHRALGAATGDAGYRSVIGSAYYAAYHAAAIFEENLSARSNATVQKAGSHEALLVRLERPHRDLAYGPATTSKEIGGMLRQMKAVRELAAYELTETIRVDQAEATIRNAEEVIKECGKYRTT